MGDLTPDEERLAEKLTDAGPEIDEAREWVGRIVGHAKAVGQANATRNFSASLPAATREREKNAWLQGFDTAVNSHPSQWRFLRSRSPFEEVTTDGNEGDDQHGTPQPQ